MCGRFTLTLTQAQLEDYLKERYDIYNHSQFKLPRYNISPSNEVISILHDGSKHRVGTLKWGFRPLYTTSNRPLEIINVKGETVFDKAIFKTSVLQRRCVILADSFYEWKSEKSDKNPYRFMTDQKVFPMAAIWQTVATPGGGKIHTVAIITTHNNDTLKGIHYRMPLILTKEDEKIWLNNKIKDIPTLKKLIKPYDDKLMHFEQVSSLVNNPRNDDISLIKKIN